MYFGLINAKVKIRLLNKHFLTRENEKEKTMDLRVNKIRKVQIKSRFRRSLQ